MPRHGRAATPVRIGLVLDNAVSTVLVVSPQGVPDIRSRQAIRHLGYSPRGCSVRNALPIIHVKSVADHAQPLRVIGRTQARTCREAPDAHARQRHRAAHEALAGCSIRFLIFVEEGFTQ
jgi:hypothetical protein